MKTPRRNEPLTFDGLYGFLLGPLFRRLFSPINIPELYRESLHALSRKGHIIFAQSSESLIDTLLLNHRLKNEELPFPRIVFGNTLALFQPVSRIVSLLKTLATGKTSPFRNGFYQEFMEHSSSASLVFLDKDPQRAYPDPILELMRIQRETETPMYIVPQRIIYRRAPLKIKDASKED
ncbi:MAG: hypothetical protein RRA35_10205, partial [Desulfomonilia bacterium]|nr:hypothetical protein [Desulfomonilia bacterium]